MFRRLVIYDNYQDLKKDFTFVASHLEVLAENIKINWTNLEFRTDNKWVTYICANSVGKLQGYNPINQLTIKEGNYTADVLKELEILKIRVKLTNEAEAINE